MKRMTLIQHFSELRRRVLWTLGIFLLAFIIGWYVSPFAQDVLTRPLFAVWPNGILLYSGVADGLMVRLSLGLMVALIVTLPVALWHLWAFVAPGLHRTERNFIWPFLILSPILFLIGAGFAFYVLFPFVFGFFIELNTASPVPTVLMPVMRDYLSFTIGLLKVFGLAFQLPLVLVLLNRFGILSRACAVAMRRYAIVLLVVLAAILTPPDVVSQLLLAIPMYLLFEASIFFMHDDNK